MTGPRTDQDVERALFAWMDEVAPTRPPVRLLEETFATTMRARQDAARPWNRIDLGRGARRGWGPGPVLALVMAAALIIVAFVVALTAGSPSTNTRPVPSAPLPVASPATPSPQATTSMPPPQSVTPDAVIDVRRPMALALGGASLWVLEPGQIEQVDLVRNEVSGSASLGSQVNEYQALAASGAGVWATDLTLARLLRVDPETLEVVASIPAGLAPKGVLATADAVWVADVHGGTVLHVDPSVDEIAATVTVGPAGSSGPNWLASGLGSIWVDIPNNNTVVRINPATDRIQATITIPPPMTPCGGIAVGPDAVWVTGCDATTTIARIDPATNLPVATTELGGHGYNPVVIDGAPWVSVDPGGPEVGYLARVDPATNTVDRVLVPGSSFGGGGDIVEAAGAVWVVDGYHGTVLRLPSSAFTP